MIAHTARASTGLPASPAMQYTAVVHFPFSNSFAVLTWKEVIRFAKEGNPKPDRAVERTEEEWRAQLTPEEYRVTRLKGTERAFSSEMCSLFEPGLDGCLCCATLLFGAAGQLG